MKPDAGWQKGGGKTAKEKGKKNRNEAPTGWKRSPNWVKEKKKTKPRPGT